MAQGLAAAAPSWSKQAEMSGQSNPRRGRFPVKGVDGRELNQAPISSTDYADFKDWGKWGDMHTRDQELPLAAFVYNTQTPSGRDTSGAFHAPYK